MKLAIREVSGISGFEEVFEEGRVLYRVPGGKVFCVVNYGGDSLAELLSRPQKTVEVRTDEELAKVLMEKYESVMRARYFGRGGIEIVLTGQMSEDEIYDLVRLSYNMTAESIVKEMVDSAPDSVALEARAERTAE